MTPSKALQGDGEPVAWRTFNGFNDYVIWQQKPNFEPNISLSLEPLFTYPPDQTAKIAELEEIYLKDESFWREQNDILRDVLLEAIGYIPAYKVNPSVVDNWRKLLKGV